MRKVKSNILAGLHDVLTIYHEFYHSDKLVPIIIGQSMSKIITSNFRKRS